MHQRLLKFLTVALFFSSSFYPQGKSENFYLKGRVLDLSTGIALEFANIILLREKDNMQELGTVSDREGNFLLQDINEGSYSLKISFIGYEDNLIKGIIAGKNKSMDVGNIFLVPVAYGVEDVIVSTERAPVSYEIDKKVINVDGQLAAASGTAIDILQNVPSVTVDIEGNVSLRGSGNFRVLIDGRPTILDASEALQQILASSIENIEIITNPSAKFNPEGTAGIINIVLKKAKRKGMSGVVALNGGLGEKYGAELLGDYKTEDFHATLGLDYNDRIFRMTNTEKNWTESNGIRTYRNSDGNSNWGRNSYSGRASFAFEPYNAGSMTLGGRYRDREHSGSTNQIFTQWNNLAIPSETSNSISERSRGGYGYEIFTNFTHKFEIPGHEISAEIDFESDDGDELTTNELIKNGSIVSGQRFHEFGPGTEFGAKLDYVLPLGEKSKFEAGYNGESEFSDEGTGLFNYNSATGNYVEDILFSNQAQYEKTTHAIYSLCAGSISDFGYQFGFRTEYTGRQIDLVRTNQSFSVSRWDYFPSAHFSMKFEGGNQIMTSYTRRINRPRGWELEPFITPVDAYNVRSGNPDLLPEYIDSYELGYQMLFGKSIFSVEGYHRFTINKIEHVRSVYSDNITLMTSENVGEDYSTGIELFYNFDPLNSWNVNLMANIYDYRVSGSMLGNSFDRKSFNWNLRFNNDLKIGETTQLQLNSIYNSASVSSQGTVEASAFVNFAVKHEIMKDFLTATLQVNDIFGTAKRESTYQTPELYNYGLSQRESPVVMLNLRFNFNNYKNDRREQGGDGMDMGGQEF